MKIQEILDKVHTNPAPILSLMDKSADGKGYICPFCGHGKGTNNQSKDGLTISSDPNNPNCGRFNCFVCGAHGDVIDIYQKIKGISDQQVAFVEVANLYGLQIDRAMPVDPATLTKEKIDRRVNELAAADIQRAQQNQNHPAYIEYLTTRGIRPEIASRYGLGFISDWQHPKLIAEGKNPPKSPRLIIPTGKYSYTARDIRADEQIPEESRKYIKQKVGTAGIFNSTAIRNATRPLFIVEGEIDALSIITVGGQAVGLGSTNNIDKFTEELRKAGNRLTQEPFIVALDNDNAGNKATGKLAAGLDELKIKYTIANPAGEYKDSNEALQREPEGFVKRVQKAERAELDADSNAAFIESLRERFLHTPAPLPTGFKELDNLLDGGLLAGLYFIGGVSSSGKTAFAMQIVDQVAKAGGECLVFAAEMSRADLIARSISRETVGNRRFKFTQREVQGGYKFAGYSQEQMASLDKAYKAYQQYAGRITIYENRGDNMKPKKIRERIARYCTITGTRPLILIDYLQILTPENDRQDIRFCIDETIRALKGISSEFNLPVIVISSLNRDNYTAPLNFAAFKESGNIEYAADYLLGLQFSIVHDLEQGQSKQAENLAKLAEEKQKPVRNVEIAILKQRGGKSAGSVNFAYDAMHNYYKEIPSTTGYRESESDPEEYAPLLNRPISRREKPL